MRGSNVIDFSRLKAARRERAMRELIELTDTILETAETNDWLQAVELQRQRRELLETFFAEAAVPDEADTVAQAIQYMLDVDARVTAIVYAQREQLLDSASDTHRANQAAKAYLSHSE